jgi:hypothetical protein
LGIAPGIAGGAELHREPKLVVVSTAKRDETAVAVIEMEVSSEVCRAGFTIELAAPPLFIRQKRNRHRDFLPPRVTNALTSAVLAETRVLPGCLVAKVC